MLLDKTRTVKIADFGVARVEASNPNDMTGETGTLGYMAPEVYSPSSMNSNQYHRVRGGKMSGPRLFLGWPTNIFVHFFFFNYLSE